MAVFLVVMSTGQWDTAENWNLCWLPSREEAEAAVALLEEDFRAAVAKWKETESPYAGERLEDRLANQNIPTRVTMIDPLPYRFLDEGFTLDIEVVPLGMKKAPSH